MGREKVREGGREGGQGEGGGGKEREVGRRIKDGYREFHYQTVHYN